jgi:hypothetical protein
MLLVVHFDFCLGCAKTKSKDFEQVRHAPTDNGSDGWIIDPSFWFIGSLEERDVTVHAWDPTASATLALAEDKHHKKDERRQEEDATE